MDTQKAELNPTPAETESAQTNESGEISKLESRIDKNERIGDHPADIVAYDVKVLQFESRCELMRSSAILAASKPQFSKILLTLVLLTSAAMTGRAENMNDTKEAITELGGEFESDIAQANGASIHYVQGGRKNSIFMYNEQAAFVGTGMLTFFCKAAVDCR